MLSADDHKPDFNEGSRSFGHSAVGNAMRESAWSPAFRLMAFSSLKAGLHALFPDLHLPQFPRRREIEGEFEEVDGEVP
jgi:hypothetical protein